MKFEELFFLQLSILLNKLTLKKIKSNIFKKIDYNFNKVYECLPFTLTNAQKSN